MVPRTLKLFGRMAIVAGVVVGFFPVVAMCLGYGLARIFIVVECFIAFFAPVPGVFEVPSWSAYFPHIT